MAASALRAVTHFMQQELEVVKILRTRLEQDIGEVRLDEALDGRRRVELRVQVEQHVIVVPRAMADERGDVRRFPRLSVHRQAQLVRSAIVALEVAGEEKFRAKIGIRRG